MQIAMLRTSKCSGPWVAQTVILAGNAGSTDVCRGLSCWTLRGQQRMFALLAVTRTPGSRRSGAVLKITVHWAFWIPRCWVRREMLFGWNDSPAVARPRTWAVLHKLMVALSPVPGRDGGTCSHSSSSSPPTERRRSQIMEG